MGLAAVLQYSAKAFFALKLLGVVYLLYLALQAFREGPTPRNVNGVPKTSSWKIFRNGAYASIFNPKISLLMLALLPQFVRPEAANPELQIATMGAMHALVAAVVHTHLIFFSGSLAKHIKESGKLQKVLRWVTGFVFINNTNSIC